MQNYKVKSRYFINENFVNNLNIKIVESNYHHLKNVLRASIGDYFTIFNKECGEYICQIVEISKNYINAKIIEKTAQYKQPNIKTTIAFAPLKQDANAFVLEKATELGANDFINIITQKTVNKPQDIEKNWFKCKLASEQCKRLDVPSILQQETLVNFLNKNTKPILWLNEKLLGSTITQWSKNEKLPPSEIILLFGPEGGFSLDEFEILKADKLVHPIFLNTNILRAETAIVASLVSLYTAFGLM
jgi:16S rRNA (uracil1498-N3)-methyltransferase